MVTQRDSYDVVTKERSDRAYKSVRAFQSFSTDKMYTGKQYWKVKEILLTKIGNLKMINESKSHTVKKEPKVSNYDQSKRAPTKWNCVLQRRISNCCDWLIVKGQIIFAQCEKWHCDICSCDCDSVSDNSGDNWLWVLWCVWWKSELTVIEESCQFETQCLAKWRLWFERSLWCYEHVVNFPAQFCRGGEVPLDCAES